MPPLEDRSLELTGEELRRLIDAAAVRSAAAVVIWHLYAAKYFLGPLASSAEETRAAALDGCVATTMQ